MNLFVSLKDAKRIAKKVGITFDEGWADGYSFAGEDVHQIMEGLRLLINYKGTARELYDLLEEL